MSFPFNACAIAKPDMFGVRRSANGFKVTNTIPALALLVNPLIDSPGNATAFSTPGCSSAICDILRITASVRSNAAPSGSWANATRYCLSCAGMNPRGTAWKPA